MSIIPRQVLARGGTCRLSVNYMISSPVCNFCCDCCSINRTEHVKMSFSSGCDDVMNLHLTSMFLLIVQKIVKILSGFVQDAEIKDGSIINE